MAINIDTLVHNEFGRSASDQLVKLTGKPTGKVQAGVERAITEVLDGFSMKARDEAGRQSLYEAARYCDDGLIDDPSSFFGSDDQRTALTGSNNTLGVLIGADNRQGIAEAIRGASGLSAEDADMVTGYVTPGVLGVMKRQMLNGAVLDNSDGIGQMLLGEVHTAKVGGAAAAIDHSVPKTAPRQTQSTHAASSSASARTSSTTPRAAGGAGRGSAGGSAGRATGGAASAAASQAKESDHSWLFRYAMPVLLLGGLVLAGAKNCGPDLTAGGETSAQKLAAVQTEADGLKGQITSLTAERDLALSDRETAVGEIDRLQGELEAANNAPVDTSELDAANAEIATLNEQLAQPADTSELDAATAEIATLKEQLAQPADTSELDAATAEIAMLKEQLAQPADTSALDAANAEIASLKSQVAQPADDSALNAEIMSLKNQLASVPAPVDNSGEIAALTQSVDDGQLKIAQLESEIGTVRESRAELEESMAALNAENLNAEARTTELKEKLLEVAGAKNRMEAQIPAMESKVEVMQANLDRAVDDATAKRKELGAVRSEISGLQGQVDAEKAKRQALSTRLGNAIAFSKQRASQVETLQVEADSGQARSKALSSRLSNAIAFSKERASQNEMLQAQLTSEQAKSKALNSRLGNAIAFSKERAETIDKVTKGRSAAITTVKDLVGKLGAAESEVAARDGQIGELQGVVASEQDKRKALSSRLSNAIAFSKERAALIDSLSSENQGFASQIDSLSAQNQDLAAQMANADTGQQEEKDRVASLSFTLSDELAAAGLSNVFVRPVEDSQAVGITMGSSDLYGVGSATLSSQGTDMLGTVGAIISNYGEWRIDVEGHTDGQPIGSVLQKRYPSNWELSTARAAAAVRYLQSNLGIPPEKLSVRGFGEHKPVDTNSTAEGREANRRIELILRQ